MGPLVTLSRPTSSIEPPTVKPARRRKRPEKILKSSDTDTPTPTSKPNRRRKRPEKQNKGGKETIPPTWVESTTPTIFETIQPSSSPTLIPEASSPPSSNPTLLPSSNKKTSGPSSSPTLSSESPSTHPIVDTLSPTLSPSILMSNRPSFTPSSISIPSFFPTILVSSNPTIPPTISDSSQPSLIPSVFVTEKPTTAPTISDSGQPSLIPSVYLTAKPTTTPTNLKSSQPSQIPSILVSTNPSLAPTILDDSSQPSQPSILVTDTPTLAPSILNTTISYPPTSSPTDTPIKFEPLEFTPDVDYLIGELDYPSRNYQISCTIQPLEKINAWGKLIKFTADPYGIDDNYGDRAPLIQFKSDSFLIRVNQGTISDPNHHITSDIPLNENVDNDIRILSKGDKTSLYINGTLTKSMDTPFSERPQIEKLYIYAGDSKNKNPAKAIIKNLVFTSM